MSVSSVATLQARDERSAAIHSRWRIAIPYIAAALLVGSLAFPYWQMTLYAPQYPEGLRAWVYLTHAAGDSDEISALNHYVGLGRLDAMAQAERQVSIPLVLMTAVALIVSVSLRRLRLILRLPVFLFPVGFAADLAYWLWRFGHSIDASAPIRIDPFMPALLGRGSVMQFSTGAFFGIGFAMALGAAVLAAYDLWAQERTT